MSLPHANTTFYFIRHGEVDNPNRIIYGQTIDVPLSLEGFSQMQELASRLKEDGIEPNVIYTSPLARTVQSANELSKIFPQASIFMRDELKDTSEGSLAGKTLDWLKSLGGDEYDEPGVESPESIEKRMAKVTKDLISQYEGKTIFIVGSGDPIAFHIWQLMHHEAKLPRLSELNKSGYLKKGEAWKIVLTPNLDVVENEIISRDEHSTKGEREY